MKMLAHPLGHQSMWNMPRHPLLALQSAPTTLPSTRVGEPESAGAHFECLCPLAPSTQAPRWAHAYFRTMLGLFPLFLILYETLLHFSLLVLRPSF